MAISRRDWLKGTTAVTAMAIVGVFAALIGWWVFAHAPDAFGWLGMAVVTVCGAGSAWLNVREAAQAREPVSALGADTIMD